MRRNSGPSFRNSGAYTSPGTPDYNDNLPKTWSSERMPLHTSRRHLTSAASMPFNSGRALPSKWDDAERWITSPISGYGAYNTVAARPQRRSRSKSGPLAPMGIVYLPNYSPTMPLHEGRGVRNFMANSPLTTGVLVHEGLSVHYEGGIGARTNSLYVEDNGKHRDMLSETSEPSSEDEEVDGGKEEEGVVLCRDMATQMSPRGSSHSSSKGRLSFSALCPSFEQLQRKDEIRDVQVDKGTNTNNNTNTSHGLMKHQVEEMDVGDVPASWSVVDSSKNMSKLQREEAKITAWENLQKAKAEAAVRKLEMKLEKKRSASMDKITNKLEHAQTKARVMRNSLSSVSEQRTASRKRISCSLYFKIFSICNCFSCTKR